MQIIIKSPKECNETELLNFYNLLQTTGQVSNNNLINRIKNAELLGFSFIENNLAGITALKNPKPEYKEKIFLKAGIAELANKYLYELGYAVTLPEYRNQGIALKLAEELLKHSNNQNVYAAIKTTNLQPQNILTQVNFKKIGKPYQSKSEVFQIFGFEFVS